MRDLELIKSDSDTFEIVWHRIQTVAPQELLDEAVIEEEPPVLDNSGPIPTLKPKTKKVIYPSTIVFFRGKNKMP